MAFVFPFFMVAVDNIRSVVLFKRGGKFDPQAGSHSCTTPGVAPGLPCDRSRRLLPLNSLWHRSSTCSLIKSWQAAQ